MMKPPPMFNEVIQPRKATLPLVLTAGPGTVEPHAVVNSLGVTVQLGAAAEAGALPVSVYAGALVAVVAFTIEVLG
jgi:hypothetical protein